MHGTWTLRSSAVLQPALFLLPLLQGAVFGGKCSLYIDALIKEIHLSAGRQKEKKPVTSLYFGGGTPALAAPRLKEIIDALQEHFIITEGIGLELHPDNVTNETLRLLKEAGITKISIGIQSFQDKYLNILGRRAFDCKRMAEALSNFPLKRSQWTLYLHCPVRHQKI